MTSLAPSNTKDLSQSQQILLQKQKEHFGLLQLRDASKDLLERVEKLAEMQHVMADGGEAIGQVMKNWPHVFAILNMLDKPSDGAVDGEVDPIPIMVRLPYTGGSEEQNE